MDGGLGLRLFATAALATGVVSCSVLFSADDLSRGTTTSTGAGGATGTSASGGATAATTTAASGGAPSTSATTGGRDAGCTGDSDCDDDNPCTVDTCDSTGCQHTKLNGTTCNDGNACDAPGTCQEGTCQAAAVQPDDVCIVSDTPCRPGYYVTDYHCNTSPLCNGCSLCVNAFTCTWACTPTVTACCNIGTGDCTMVCPSGYHPTGSPITVAACGCGGTSNAIVCATN